MNLYLLNKQNVNTYLEIFAKRQVHRQSLWTVDVTDLSEPLKKLDGIEAGFGDEIILFRASNKSYVQFWEVYKIHQNTPLKIANEGYWSEESGISLENDNHRNQRLRDLQGLQLKVASKVSKPYISEIIPDDETDFKMSGLFAEVFFNLQVSPRLLNEGHIYESIIAIHLLQSIMNFTFKVEKPPDGEWGVKLSNNSWTGMVGMLIRKEIDIGNILNHTAFSIKSIIFSLLAVTDFTVTKERSPYISFSQPLQTYYHTLLGQTILNIK